MGMTEPEALSKACCKGGETIQQNGSCITSRCMAWRWSRAKETKAYLDAVQDEMKASSVNFNIATQTVWARMGSSFEQVEGYCGLAGKPE